MADVSPKWLDHARLHIGTREKAGKGSNPQIMEFFRTVGYPGIEDDSETSWCAAFVGAMLHSCGYPLPPHPSRLLARSYLTYGRKLEAPEPGCIVVFWRGSPNSWQGHVGFYMGEEDDYVLVLGGNQSNAVNISKYKKSQVLGYRWPVAVDPKELEAAGSTEIAMANKVKKAVKVVVPTAVTLEAVNDLGVVESAKQWTEGLGTSKALLEGIQAVLTLITSNALIFVAALGVGVYFFADWMKRKRLQRHAQGAALSRADVPAGN